MSYDRERSAHALDLGLTITDGHLDRMHCYDKCAQGVKPRIEL